MLFRLKAAQECIVDLASADTITPPSSRVSTGSALLLLLTSSRGAQSPSSADCRLVRILGILCIVADWTWHPSLPCTLVPCGTFCHVDRQMSSTSLTLVVLISRSWDCVVCVP
eukprot:4553604-Amphidinium_carterae.1